MASWARPQPQIIIVGGSVAGLSLAVMLQAVGYENWILLEAHDHLAPQLGAGFVCNANGFRILDQLGLSDAIAASTEAPLEVANDWLSDGTFYGSNNGVSSSFKLCLGYPMLVLDRQQILTVLYSALTPENKAKKVVMGARIAGVDSDDTGVRVTAADGRSWHGDILIGADGIHSVVRREMWRLGRKQQPPAFSANEEDKISCAWRTIFGIAELPIDRVAPGSANVTYGVDKSTGLALPAEVRGDDIPHYTDEDMHEMAKKHWDHVVQGDLRFSELFESRVRASLVAMQDYVADRWHFGRIMCVGDAVHKLHHITGQGGMMCIEDAATFVNALTDALSDGKTSHLSPARIEAIFASTQASRQARVTAATVESFLAQKLHALSNGFFKMLAMRVLPSMGFDFILGKFVNMARAAPTLRGVDVPHRPVVVGFDDVNPEPSGWGKKLVDWASAAALAAASVSAIVIARGTKSPDDHHHHKDTALLSLHLTAVMSVAMLEGWRRLNKLELLQWPIIWALIADLAGVTVAAPLFFLMFQLYVHYGRGRMTYTGMRQPVVLSAAQTIFPTTVLLLVVPAVLSFFSPAAAASLPAIKTPLFATAAVLAVFLLSYVVPSPRESFDTRYIKPTMTGYVALAILLAVAHGATLPWLIAHAATAIGPAVLVALAATAVWLLAVVCDVCQHFGRSSAQTWAHAAAALASCVILGPGATTMIVWFWRESAMSRRMLGVLSIVESKGPTTA